MIALDTNVLIYAHRGETNLHSIASAKLTALAEGDEPWALPIFCITEFLRVVTHARVFNPPSTIATAIEFIENLTISPSCRLATPGSEFLLHLKNVVISTEVRGNLVFDAQIAALCREHGIQSILTNDRDFERFGNLNVQPLAAL